jgi:hypothetical protein
MVWHRRIGNEAPGAVRSRGGARPGGVAPWLLALILGGAACTGELLEPNGSGPPGAGAGGSGNAGGTYGTGGVDPTGTTYVASESVARRLSQAELDNTVRDVFGDTTRPATKFLIEDEYTPYDNNYTLQAASRTLIDSLEALAEDVAVRALADPAQRAKLVPCTPSGPGDSACFRQVIQTVGRRVFRRELREEEITRYLTLQSFATEQNQHVNPDFYTAVELFIRSVLQDPEFVYRIEVGTPTSTPGIYTLDANEIASRMSYLLWGSAPDDTLLSEAASGSLTNASTRQSVAERMLDDQRARQQLHRFHAMWLGYRAIPHPTELVTAFNQETTRLIDRVIFDEPRDYLELFRASETYLTDFLADHYGLPRPASGAGWVPYGATGRAGILSHGSVLAGFSKFSDTSPTQRGIFVKTRLLCQKIRPPPANVDVDQPPGDDEQACKSDRYSAHREIESCAACHGQMDPIGFGLENYDVAGRYRSHDEGLPQCTITGAGELPGHGTFTGPAELAQKLIDANLVEPCVVKQYFSFAVGRDLVEVEVQATDALAQAFARSGRTFEQLLIAHVSSEAFALRKEPFNP